MTMRLRTISAAGCEVRMGLAILVAQNYISPQPFLLVMCFDGLPLHCALFGQQILNTQHQIFTL